MRSEAEIRECLREWGDSRPRSDEGREEKDTVMMMLKWVLNDPAPINIGDSESKPEASGG